MFKKPYNTKGKSNLRNSERKKLFVRLPEVVKTTLNAEKNIYAQRVQAGLKLCTIYGGDRCLLFFETQYDEVLYPTVYTLWRCQSAYPVFLVHTLVMEKLQGGADLMLPGVINTDDACLSNIVAGSPVAISMLTDDGVVGPIMVGKALLSFTEMQASGMKGRGVQIMHYYRDFLWEVGDKSHPPLLNFTSVANVADLVSKKSAVANEPTKTMDKPIEKPTEDTCVKELHNDDEAGDSTNLENVLRKTFLAAVRNKIDAKMQFPIDVGQFYATFVLKNLPSDVRMDLKRTKYKKFSTFLHAINDECDSDNGWLVKVSTSKKGVDSIDKLNFEHPLVKNAEFAMSASTLNSLAHRIRVSDCFSATEAILPFLRRLPNKRIQKGDVIQPNELRNCVLEYAKLHNLNRDEKIELDDTLQMVIKHFVADMLPVNDIVQRIGSQMTKCSMVSSDYDASFRKVYKGLLPSVEMKVEKRSGNKVVTLINNLSVFGIDERSLCQRIQNGQATGTSITQTAPNCQGAQVLAHGNVVNFVGGELINEYGLQKKFIKGLELGVKEKKKKLHQRM